MVGVGGRCLVGGRVGNMTILFFEVACVCSLGVGSCSCWADSVGNRATPMEQDLGCDILKEHFF